MPIGDSISQPIPAVGTAGEGYAAQLVEFLQEIKARLEAKVALTSLLAGLFDMSNNGIANAKYVGLYEQVSVPSTPIGSVQRYGGELYYVSPSGAVRITNNGSLDVVSANGITGDYAAPAEFRYDLGALEYFAYSNETAGEWARVGAQGFDIYGTLTGATRVRLAWAGGANPSYTLTLPATVPAGTVLIRMNNAGSLLTSGDIDEDVKLVANRNVEVSGTGKYKHGTKTVKIPVLARTANSAGVVSETGGTPGAVQSAGIVAYYPIFGLPPDATISKFRVECSTAPGATVTFEPVTVDATGPSWTSFGVTQAGSAVSNITDITTTWNAAVNAPIWIKCTTGASPLTLVNIWVQYSVA
jgi:hypothetical protein